MKTRPERSCDCAHSAHSTWHRSPLRIELIVQAVASAMILLTASAVWSQNVVGPTNFQSCTSNLTFNNSNGGSLICNAVIDGDTSGSSGTFNEVTGQIPGALYNFQFVQDQDLTDFYLWNDRGAADSGIANFELTFFDSSSTFLGTYSSAAALPFKGSSPTPEIFNFGSTIPAVRFVDLEVMSTLHTGPNTQLREIAFNAVPEPSGLALLGLGGLLIRRRWT